MRLLEVVESSFAGVGRHVRSLCENIAAAGHQVVVAYAPHRADEAFRRFVIDRRDEIRFLPLDVRREVSPVSDARGLFRLLRLIRYEGPFDVIHGHSSKGGALARIAGRVLGVPTVYTPHSLVISSPEISRWSYLAYAWIERALGQLATSKLIAVSTDERDFVIKLGLTPADRVVIIENAIDDRDFERSSGVIDDGETNRKPLTFGSAMRFSSQKAPGYLLEAFVQASRGLPEVPMRLVIVGDGELFADVKRRVERSGMRERISLPGWRTDAESLLRGFDVFVLSSLYEGFSYVILEAMAAKLPVVSTDVFGVKDTICRVPGNIVVPAGDPNALADGMKRMVTLTEPSSLRRALRKIGRANHDYARAHFRQSDVTRRTLDLYRELASERHSAFGRC